MSDERQDDEITGRALARAVETIEVNETPYERSALAVRPRGRWALGRWGVFGTVAAVVTAVVLGASLNALREAREVPAVASPGIPVAPTAPAASAVAVPAQPVWVYFARDGLPPVGTFVNGVLTDDSRESRILSRLSLLTNLQPNLVPAGAANPLGSISPPANGQRRVGTVVRVDADVANVEFDLPTGWGVRGSAQSQALLQQLVYVITEEPGVRAARITDTGKTSAVIDQLVVDRSLSREDVSGYSAVDIATRINQDGAAGGRLSYATSADKLSPGLTRFVLTAQSAEIPQFSVSAEKWDNGTAADPGKYLLRVQVLGSYDKLGLETFNTSPLRGVMTRVNVATGTGSAVTTYELRLDDLRPWRVLTLINPTRIVVDIGGTPQAISDRIAVYSPTVGAAVSHDFSVSGLARVFEATVSWRVRDSAQRVVASGVTNASLGTSAIWGAFETTVKLPQTVTGNVTLEVYEASAKDGSEVGLVRVPLAVR